MWAHDFCLLSQIFITHNFLYHYVMAMQFSVHSQHLLGFMMQVTECTYSVPILRYDMLDDGQQFVPTCPVFAGPVTYHKTFTNLSLFLLPI